MYYRKGKWIWWFFSIQRTVRSLQINSSLKMWLCCELLIGKYIIFHFTAHRRQNTSKPVDEEWWTSEQVFSFPHFKSKWNNTINHSEFWISRRWWHLWAKFMAIIVHFYCNSILIVTTPWGREYLTLLFGSNFTHTLLRSFCSSETWYSHPFV